MFRVLQVTRTFDDCIDRTCNYGAAVDQQMMEVKNALFVFVFVSNILLKSRF